MKLIYKTYFLSAAILFSFNINAQNKLPPAYEITSDTALNDTLPNAYWQLLEDKKGKLTFAQVIKPPIVNNFNYKAKLSDTNYKARDYLLPSLNTDHKPGGYWFRYVLKNIMDRDAEICFGFKSFYEQSDYYFINEKGKVTHQVNGFFSPWSKLNGIKEYRVIPLKLKPGEKIIVYHRLYSTNHVFVSTLSDKPVVFSSVQKVMEQIYEQSQTDYFNAIHDVFIVGVLAFASLFIFMFFMVIHEKVYLYFSLYLLSLSIGRFNTNAEMYEVFFREHPYLFSYIFSFIWFFSIFFLTHFIRYLLNTRQYLPAWDKFLVVFNTIYALTYLLARIVDFATVYHSFSEEVVTYEQIVLALSIVVTFLISLKRFKNTKVLTYIVLPLQSIWSICWSIAICSQVFGVITIPWLDTNWYGLETILLCCLVISFSWILINRFGELKKQVIQKELEKEIERSQLIEQQKILLENTVEERTTELKQSLQELKSTQSQLIQSEKMASLGELTAGIAHEIQNPLNFVNNFSDVNKELIEELNVERRKPKAERDEQLENEILNDLKENEEKINNHGKRADAIVKGMLQHSRQSSGQKEPTDINALADEYLRLSYHGMRAKDKDFEAKIKTDFDDKIGKINIVPQDIGRVLLNLFNNAFYAVNEQKIKNPDLYEPTVLVTTKKSDNHVIITVSDNGNGIPQQIIDKIFQPFFTTKPTGEGTGLGLSLSYDIIKAHGGEIKVESKEGEGSEFIIQLSI